MVPNETVEVVMTVGFFLLFYSCFRFLLSTREQEEREQPEQEEQEEAEETPVSNEEIESELLASGELSEDERLLALLDPEAPPTEPVKGSRENLKALYQAGILSRKEYQARLARMKDQE